MLAPSAWLVRLCERTCLCARLRLGLACSSTGVQHYGGRGRACHRTGVLLPRQQTVFVYMAICVCVCVRPSNTDNKSLHSCYMCAHSCTHTHAHSASKVSLFLNCVSVRCTKYLKHHQSFSEHNPLSLLLFPSSVPPFLGSHFSFSSHRFPFFSSSLVLLCETKDSFSFCVSLREMCVCVHVCVSQLPCPFIMMLSDACLCSFGSFSAFGFDHHSKTHPFTLHLCTPSHTRKWEKGWCVRVCVCP